MDESKTIQEIFQRYLDNDCTPGEIQSLFQYFGREKNEDELRSLIRLQLESTIDQEILLQKEKEYLLKTAFVKIKEAITPEVKINQAPIVSFYSKKWLRVSAAAVIFVLLSIGAFFTFQQKDRIKIADKTKDPIHTDIAPGTNDAILTLADGTTVVLDSAPNGTLAQQGSTNVLKINGQIAYQKKGTEAMNTKPVYNTITTANGNQYQLVLTDGTKVWLNAASSIRFPTSFTGNERKVEITGEAYFEVAKNAQKVFKVAINNQAGQTGEIEVLGTHFNVNAYSEEPDIKTTLLEGSVKIKKAGEVQMLSPGQQAKLTSNGILVNKNANLQQVMAWKDGFFLFDNTDISTLMRQVARWYNVEVSFEGKIGEEGFTGKISRNVPLSKFLEVLELNEVHVKTEGKKITIKP